MWIKKISGKYDEGGEIDFQSEIPAGKGSSLLPFLEELRYVDYVNSEFAAPRSGRLAISIIEMQQSSVYSSWIEKAGKTKSNTVKVQQRDYRVGLQRADSGNAQSGTRFQRSALTSRRRCTNHCSIVFFFPFLLEVLFYRLKGQKVKRK